MGRIWHSRFSPIFAARLQHKPEFDTIEMNNLHGNSIYFG